MFVNAAERQAAEFHHESVVVPLGTRYHESSHSVVLELVGLKVHGVLARDDRPRVEYYDAPKKKWMEALIQISGVAGEFAFLGRPISSCYEWPKAAALIAKSDTAGKKLAADGKLAAGYIMAIAAALQHEPILRAIESVEQKLAKRSPDNPMLPGSEVRESIAFYMPDEKLAAAKQLLLATAKEASKQIRKAAKAAAK